MSQLLKGINTFIGDKMRKLEACMRCEFHDQFLNDVDLLTIDVLDYYFLIHCHIDCDPDLMKRETDMCLFVCLTSNFVALVGVRSI